MFSLKTVVVSARRRVDRRCWHDVAFPIIALLIPAFAFHVKDTIGVNACGDEVINIIPGCTVYAAL
jgi:hypothetical protein